MIRNRDTDTDTSKMDNSLPAPNLADIGDRLPVFAAWCMVSRSSPDPDQPKTITAAFSPHRGRTLPPCDVGVGACRRHGNLQGSLNEVSTTNGPTFDFDRDDFADDYGTTIHGREVVQVQQAMMLSRQRSRQAYQDEHEEENSSHPRRKVPRKSLMRAIAQRLSSFVAEKDIVRFRLPVGAPLPWNLSVSFYPPETRHLAARAHRIAVTLKADNKYFSGGKYNPATFMGLPAEVHLLIFKFYFRNLTVQSHVVTRPLDPRPIPQYKGFSEGQFTRHPFAILQTSKLLYLEGIEMFQRHAVFVSGYEPMLIIGVDDTGMQKYELQARYPVTWKNVKRWRLMLKFPDLGEGQALYPGIFPWVLPGMQEVLGTLITQHLRHLVKDDCKLDELTLDLGEYQFEGPIERFGVLRSRFQAMKALIPLAGMVKKMKIVGRILPELKAYARKMEIYVQGYDDEAGVSGKSCIVEPPLDFDQTNDDDSEDTDDDEDDDGDDDYWYGDVADAVVQVPVQKTVSSRMETARKEEHDALEDNINTEYDGPDDDGLGWLDSEEAFDIGCTDEDRLVGEMKLEDIPVPEPLPELLAKSLRKSRAR